MAQSGPERRRPLIRIVCPVCGVLAWANALDKAGQAASKCRGCKGLLIIQTDEDGCLIGIDGHEPEPEPEPKKKAASWNWNRLKEFWPLLLIGVLALMFFKACNTAAPIKAVVGEPPGVTAPSRGSEGQTGRDDAPTKAEPAGATTEQPAGGTKPRATPSG